MTREQTHRKIERRLLPYLLFLYITAQIDRANVGFAGLRMTKELGFSNTVFGFGAGIFFFGYCLLQIPGAVLAEAWSARRWISIVLVAWGVVATGTGLIHSASQFTMARFLLGVAEGGFFPAVVVYLTHWFTNEQRAKAVAWFMAGIPLSSVIGAPISGLLLQVHWMGIASWRWLLVLEGLPALLAGIVTLFYLPDKPSDASWLSPDEREQISSELHRDSQGQSLARRNVSEMLRNPVVIAVTLSYFFLNTSAYGLQFWFPKIVQRLSGLGTLELSFVVAIPYLVSVPAMFACGWHSDKTGERRWHAALTAALGGSGLALSQLFNGSPFLALAAFTLATIGILSYYPPMWALPTQLLTKGTAAASYGFINLVANLGGFVGPYAVGFLTDRTGKYAAGVYALVATAFLSALIIVCARPRDTADLARFKAAEA